MNRRGESIMNSRMRGTAWKLLRRLRRSEGQAMVEFALLSPLVLLLCVGMCVFGLGLKQYMDLCNATAIGAQQLATSGQLSDPCQYVYTTVTDAAPGLTAANLTFTITVNGTAYVTGASGSSVTCSGEASSFQQAQESANENATITVTYPFTASFIGFTKQTYTMSDTVEEVIE